jgi:hypothetical protein
MGLIRLGISNPAATTATAIFTANNQYLVSVIATNKSLTTSANIRVWVEPSGSSTESQYAYMIYDLPVGAQNSYETFRFAINQNDVIKVYSSTANVSFSAYGLVQYDINLGLGISSYSSTAPSNPINGMIWVDSTTVALPSLNVYNGSSWTNIVDSTEKTMTISLSDETSSITTGTAKLTFRAPHAMSLTKIPRASLSTASTSGLPTVDIKKNGTSIFSTLLTINANQTTSVTATTAAVLSTTSFSDNDEITFDITVAGTGAKGLKINLYYKRT